MAFDPFCVHNIWRDGEGESHTRLVIFCVDDDEGYLYESVDGEIRGLAEGDELLDIYAQVLGKASHNGGFRYKK